MVSTVVFGRLVARRDGTANRDESLDFLVTPQQNGAVSAFFLVLATFKLNNGGRERILQTHNSGRGRQRKTCPRRCPSAMPFPSRPQIMVPAVGWHPRGFGVHSASSWEIRRCHSAATAITMSALPAASKGRLRGAAAPERSGGGGWFFFAWLAGSEV